MASMYWKSLILALALQAASASQSRPRDKPQTGYIDVSVGTLWTDSSKPRAVDQPSLTNPAQVQQWLDSMTVDQFRDLTSNSRTQTQALYGQRLDILNQTEGWYEVAVPGQISPKNSLGYPGWIPMAQVSFDTSFGKLQNTKPFALVDKAPRTTLYRDAAMDDAFIKISYDTRLPVLGQTPDAIQVAVPGGGSAYVSARDATVYQSEAHIPYPSSDDLVKAAKMFLGRPYLWGGTSGFAFDCSGFTHTLYHAHGITLGRDADAQATKSIDHGKKVEQSELEAGDLIFYASDLNETSSIYHVAMYVGGGKMAEAYDAGTPVRITPVRFNSDYFGAQRFLK